MSTITTPPEERHPILTYVGARDDAQITAAIHRELLRDGQIFYIHNRVESIDQAAQKIQKLVPEARIRIAHGQMSEGALEDVILAFWNRDFDVLVCTTIVESGLDIANANTLIVERADLFGLSQLPQVQAVDACSHLVFQLGSDLCEYQYLLCNSSQRRVQTLRAQLRHRPCS